MAQVKNKYKGFASMPKDRLKQVSADGGKKSQGSGKGFRWSKLEARAHAKAGGKARWSTKV